MPVSRLTLTDFRSYAAATIEPGPGFVLLFGENGAGKTNLLEAVSMLTPGPGPARRGAVGDGAARRRRCLGGRGAGSAIRTSAPGRRRRAPERRQVRINGAPASVNSLCEWLSVLWLTPAMDRLFTGSAGDRRRFLDRLVLALEPGHAHHASRYEAAMRARNKLLAEDGRDEAWLASLELAMAEHGAAIARRARPHRRRARAAAGGGARGRIRARRHRAGGLAAGDLAAVLHANRARDAAAGRATEGPHRQDLAVLHRAKQMPAAQSSTGEQKALLLGLVLAHAELVAERRGEPPILLLDEVAAHLDPKRRAALFARLEGRGQVWMTATEAALFEGIGDASRFHVQPGQIATV